MEATSDLVFSDRGAWHGYALGPGGALHCVTLTDGSRRPLGIAAAARSARVHPDRLEATLDGGASLSVRFADARTAILETDPAVAIEAPVAPDDPFELRESGPGRYLHEFLEGPVGHGPDGEGPDLDDLPGTLRRNWRAPLRDIRHGGVIPSPHAYRGFWAWDSWKHAAALPRHLAREQIRAMFDHQRDDGMVPDTVLPDARLNNWRCTKPPLAAWACAKHRGLLEEFQDALLGYHRWWEANRRPPGERLFAYGGSDLEASRWESGWDNATRFDAARLVSGVQSVLAVDLNAYLCLEKRLLGIPDPELERLVNETFFHGGAFHDVTWPDHRPVPTLTAATWIPLWCGIATRDRAEAVMERMLDPAHFATELPFPTVARSDPKFDPDGYWRGPVWMDHAAFAVEALARYNRVDEARGAARRLLEAPPDWECYNPLTGEPARGERPAVAQFSWTAAARVWLEAFLAGDVRIEPPVPS